MTKGGSQPGKRLFQGFRAGQYSPLKLCQLSKNPFLIGYGAGVRTMLLGYYVKFDYAWGLEDGIINKPIAYLTLGYDF